MADNRFLLRLHPCRQKGWRRWAVADCGRLWDEQQLVWRALSHVSRPITGFPAVCSIQYLSLLPTVIGPPVIVIDRSITNRCIRFPCADRARYVGMRGLKEAQIASSMIPCKDPPLELFKAQFQSLVVFFVSSKRKAKPVPSAVHLRCVYTDVNYRLMALNDLKPSIITPFSERFLALGPRL